MRLKRGLSIGAAVMVLATSAAYVASQGGGAAAANGWTTSATVGSSMPAPGSTLPITVSVKASSTRQALVDVEIYRGSTKVFQQFWDRQSFTANVTRTFSTSWTIPVSEPQVLHSVKVGMFSSGWGTLFDWNANAASFTPMTMATTTTTAAATTTTAPATTTTTTPTAHFGTLPPGSALPSDATCAGRVRPAAEIRSGNTPYNQTRGGAQTPPSGLFQRVTGNFVGTTDEIIQWTACKWGIDEDIVRAQSALESWWQQWNGGDFGTDPSRCAPERPIGYFPSHPNECPESIGIQQDRYPYMTWAFPSAIFSTAYNLDTAYAHRRNCFEGNETWLNTVERGRDYAAGDIWGCVGMWFSGRWYTQPSVDYMNRVQDYLNQRIWTTAAFQTAAGDPDPHPPTTTTTARATTTTAAATTTTAAPTTTTTTGGGTTTTMAAMHHACPGYPDVTPIGALPPALPMLCDMLGTGPTTFVNGGNSWVDDFNHGLSMATLGAGYKTFENQAVAKSGTFRHNNHWMTDVGASGDDVGGSLMRPDRSFRFENGKLVVEADFAAGILQYGDQGDAWGEITITNASSPVGEAYGPTPGQGVDDGLYAYGRFSGYDTVGIRLQPNRTPVEAYYDNTSRGGGSGCGQVWELSSFQDGSDNGVANPCTPGKQFNIEGGGPWMNPSDTTGWRTCAGTDPDTNCRDRFRWELTRTSLTLYVNGVFYMRHTALPGTTYGLPDRLVNSPAVYVYFDSWTYLKPAGSVTRFHWDHLAVNPGTP